MKYNDNGEWIEVVTKAIDTLPVGSEVDYDGNEVPSGWSEIERYYKNSKDGVSLANNDVVAIDSCSVTASRDGLALIIVNGNFAMNSTGYRMLNIAKNGNVISPSSTMRVPSVSGNSTTLTTSIINELSTGDIITPRASQNSGSALSCDFKIWVVYL